MKTCQTAVSVLQPTTNRLRSQTCCDSVAGLQVVKATVAKLGDVSGQRLQRRPPPARRVPENFVTSGARACLRTRENARNSKLYSHQHNKSSHQLAGRGNNAQALARNGTRDVFGRLSEKKKNCASPDRLEFPERRLPLYKCEPSVAHRDRCSAQVASTTATASHMSLEVFSTDRPEAVASPPPNLQLGC